MKKCIAFSAIPGSREAWIPCVRNAQEGYALCERHSDAVAGVMMGTCVAAIATDEQEQLKRERRAERKRLAEYRRKGRARAAERTKRLRRIQILLNSDLNHVVVNDAEVGPRELIARHEQA